MLAAKIINSAALLNNFYYLSTLSFIPGAAIRLGIQLYQPQMPNQLRYVAASGATLSVMLLNKDGTTLTKSMTAFTGDQSMWYVDLTADETADLAGGNFTFELTEGAVVSKGWIQLGLEMIITGAC